MKKCCPFCFSDENIKELVFSDDGCSREEFVKNTILENATYAEPKALDFMS